MDRTLGTSRLSLLEWAFLKTLIGIDQEFTALGARSVTSMLAATVEIYHDRDGLAFPGYSGMSLVHGKHILLQKQTPIHKIEQKDRQINNRWQFPGRCPCPSHLSLLHPLQDSAWISASEPAASFPLQPG
jgi:hypothetical protein